MDITLVDTHGNKVEMPSKYDEFSSLANRNYSDCTETAARNALLLQETMEKYGFKGYEKEWWHFSDTDEYPVDKIFDPACTFLWYADCEEFISLRTAPSTTADVITRIPAGEEMTLLGWDGDFAMVSYQRHQGYVMGSYVKPTEQDVVRIYHQYVRYVKDSKPLKTVDLFYPDMDEDGLKELLFYYVDRFGGTQPDIVTIREGKAVSLLDDALFDRDFFLCEDNVIGQWGEGSGGTTYWFYKVENQHLKNLDCLVFIYNESTWYRSPDYTGSWDTMVPINEEERKTVAEQYIPLDSMGEDYMNTLVFGLEDISW